MPSIAIEARGYEALAFAGTTRSLSLRRDLPLPSGPVIQPARDLVILGHCRPAPAVDLAALHRVGAAGVEAAAGRRVDRARHVAVDSGARACLGIRGSAPRPAAPRYRDGAGRRTASRLSRELDDAAEIHHGDAVADMLDHGEVVRDEQVGQAELALQVDQQVDDLRLDRDVERRDRLVARRSASARARAPARCRCAGAGRRRIRADSAHLVRRAGRPARTARDALLAARGLRPSPWTPAARRRCRRRSCAD